MKVAVIGAGNVGAKAVYYIAEKNIADIVMVDVVNGLASSTTRSPAVRVSSTSAATFSGRRSSVRGTPPTLQYRGRQIMSSE